MLTLKKLAGPVAAIALSLGIGSAQAALVNFTLTGNVVYAEPGQLSGLESGDTISVVGIFDDDALVSGTGTLFFGSSCDTNTNPYCSGNSFTVTAGSYTFTEADDVSGVYPWLELSANIFVDFSFLADIGASGYFDSQVGYFDSYDGEVGDIGGTWGNIEITAVPVPAAVWLLGSGLLGLVGVTRRKIT